MLATAADDSAAQLYADRFILWMVIMKFRTGLAVISISAFVLTGCSSDGDSKASDDSKAATTAATGGDSKASGERDLDSLVTSLTDSGEFSDEQATCIAEAQLDALSDEGYDTSIENGSFSDYSDTDLGVIRATVDECIDAAAAKELLIATGIGEGFTPEATGCIADTMLGSFDSPGDMTVELNLDETGELFGEMIAVSFTECVSSEDATAFVTDIFEMEEVDAAVTSCLFSTLGAAFTPTEMLIGLVIEDGYFIDELTTATESCTA